MLQYQASRQALQGAIWREEVLRVSYSDGMLSGSGVHVPGSTQCSQL